MSDKRAEQFKCVDGIYGEETKKLALSLGLVKAPHSVVWEVETSEGWRIVGDGDWVISKNGAAVKIVKDREFKGI